MSHFVVAVRRFALAAACGAALSAGPLAAQTAAESGGEPGWTQPRTPWGDPDLQGVWRYEAAIPFERPASEQRAFLSDEEVAQIARDENERAAKLLEGFEGEAVGRASLAESPIQGNEYNSFWQDQGRPRKAYRQTSLIVDPPDGRLPFTDDARKAAARSEAIYGVGPYESYLDPDTGERCLTDGITALMWRGPNGGTNRIVQSAGYVTILHEEYRDRRIIPVDGRAHRAIRQWFGDTVGRWEGDTLVVETTQFIDRTNYEWDNVWMRVSDELRLVERFRRIGADEMEYTITVEDPKTFTQPWTAVIPIARLPEGTQIYEYACHEGNYAMSNLLRGARVDASDE
jgi:hypothetical protein